MDLGLLDRSRSGEHHLFTSRRRSLGRRRWHKHASIGHAVPPTSGHGAFLPMRFTQAERKLGRPGDVDQERNRPRRAGTCSTPASTARAGSDPADRTPVSDDLVHWDKHPANPVMEADPRWYDLLDRARWRDQSWRDPWVFRHPRTARFTLLITARSRHGEPDAAGVVGHARSLDLFEWEVLPPLTSGGDFAQVEAPQLVRLTGATDPYLLPRRGSFASATRAARTTGPHGHFAFSAKHPLIRVVGGRSARGT